MSDIIHTKPIGLTPALPTQSAYLCVGPSLSFALYYKPNWFHRKMVKLFFGWEIRLEENKSQKQLLQG